MKSYFAQPCTVKHVHETIPSRVKTLAEEKPKNVAIVVHGRRQKRDQLTRQELYHRALKVATSLLNLGIRKGDRVAFCAPNIIDWFVYDLGIMIAGGVPIHLVYGNSDVGAVLDGCVAVMLESKKDWEGFCTNATIEAGGKVNSTEYPSLKFAIGLSAEKKPANAIGAWTMIRTIDTKTALSNEDKFPQIKPEDIAFITQMTDASGASRMITHTHFDVINCPSFLTEGSGEEDARYSSNNFANTSDYPFGYIQTGAKCVNGDPDFLNDPKCFEIAGMIWQEEACNIISLSPEFVKKIREFGFRAKAVSTISDPGLTKDVIKNSFRFTDRLVVVYDNTEALRIAHMVYTKDNIDEFQEEMIGSPTDGVEIKIINQKNDIVPLGEVGTVCVKSPWIHGDSSVLLEDKWVKTNWAAYMKEGGRLFLKK